MNSNNMIKKTPIIAVTILAVALAMVGPTLSINSVEATKLRWQLAWPPSPHRKYNMPRRKHRHDLTTSFNIFKVSKTGNIGGGYFIYPLDRSGSISQANISPNNFKFIGIGAPVCPSPSFGLVSITMTQKCGEGVTVQYSAKNGERGTLGPVNVACNG